ncbi:hypothetical protein [uncultured Dysosmobacter sp.]|uniref:hypothetical protein n=1 Tax=uncultured Dysosmobacter sp. TaxID=2591384 RepID=UPI002621A2CC|nr:hypothetical protein [uncultured Dysosmobacter sp.]
MKLDREFIRDLKKQANGDGSRAARFAFLDVARDACKELSTSKVKSIFWDVVKKYGRIPVAVCVAATVAAREPDRFKPATVRWAREVLSLYTNKPPHLDSLYIDDNLRPDSIEVYAWDLIRCSIEEF